MAGDSAANPADASANPPPPNSPDEDTRLVSGASEEQYSGSETPKISAAIALIILFGVSGVCQSRCSMILPSTDTNFDKLC